MRDLCPKTRILFGTLFSRGVLVTALAAATTLTLFADNSTRSGNKIDEALQHAVAEKKVPGVVAMVAVGDHVIYLGASGKRDTTKNLPMTVDSIFRIASMSKPITSVGVMQLVEQGHVNLDEPAATLWFAKSLCPALKGFLLTWRKLFGLGLQADSAKDARRRREAYVRRVTRKRVWSS